ncbi:MAG: hypothetical protein RIQ60_4421 [Pseudomonadota bacterium]|jgi:hypothetical protein
MIKGLALTPPVIGRISIGKVVEKNGKRLPEKDDEFTLTSQVQNREGWIAHPLDEQLRQAQQAPDGPPPKLRSLPVRLLFNDPGLNLRAHYSLFDRDSGRPLCVGNGETCRRLTGAGLEQLPCPGPSGCELAQGGRCKPYGRLHVLIDPEHGPADELGTFILRTTGINSIRTLSTRMSYLQAICGDRLAGLPLELRLRGKSTTASHRAPIYYVDLTLRAGTSLAQAIETARQRQHQAGFEQAELDAAARAGYGLGAFEESEEEGALVMEEFYAHESADESAEKSPAAAALVETRPSLAQKVSRRHEQLG